eukprot:scaffold4939_cov149-Skeletonema_menzelii.AAC.8
MKLRLAAEELDHHNTSQHDADIKAGAVPIVSSILRSCSPFFIAKSEVVKYCCTILLHIYRCSQDRARASFCTDGFTLITNLLEVIEIQYRLGKLGDPKCLLLANDVICKLLDVAKVPLTMVKNKDEFVSSLVSNINGASGKYVMHLSLKSIARLSEHVENKQVMIYVKDLLRSVEVGSRHMDRYVREEAAKILLNLAWEPKNKSEILLSSIETILSLVADGGSQLYALKTLGHLGTEASNKIHLVNHNSGAVISALLHVTSSDTTQASMGIKIMGYLTCRSTCWNIGRVPGVFTTLSSLACRSDHLAPSAAKTIYKMATHIHYRPKMISEEFKTVHASMLQALVTISYSGSSEVLKYAVKAYSQQASFRRDRIQMIGHKGLLTALSMLTHDENNDVSHYAKEVLATVACDVAEARNTSVEKLLRCVPLKSKTKVKQPRCYSPTSVMDEFHFDADFHSCP